MESLHKGAKWKFRFQLYVSFIFLFIFLSIFLLSFNPNIIYFPLKILSFFLIILLFIIIIGEIFVNWTYKNWKYELTKDSLKIEKGVIVKKYKSIPYERIQNVDITRGVLARIIGFSTVDIQTAGYSVYNSQGGAGMSEGHLPAVSIDQAEKIRAFLMKKITGKKQGL
jgi:membrane protein YdbS with pleckstrin-like domain